MRTIQEGQRAVLIQPHLRGVDVTLGQIIHGALTPSRVIILDLGRIRQQQFTPEQRASPIPLARTHAKRDDSVLITNLRDATSIPERTSAALRSDRAGIEVIADDEGNVTDVRLEQLQHASEAGIRVHKAS